MVRHSTERTKGVVAVGTDAHDAPRFLHDRGLAAAAGAIHHVCHRVQGGLQQQAVVTRKQLLSNQLLHLDQEQGDTTCLKRRACWRQQKPVSQRQRTYSGEESTFSSRKRSWKCYLTMINPMKSMQCEMQWDIQSGLWPMPAPLK